MDLDFDKEIDVLLRKAAGHGEPHGGDSSHLDADELSAFAENALPEKTRQAYTLHLADCDRCRKILSGVISINAEAAPAAAAVAAPVVAVSVPWYRKMFAGPNLAYAMGGLVLVFAFFLGYTLLRPDNSASVEVSQISEPERSFNGPSAGSDEQFAAQSSNAAANTSTAGRLVASNSTMSNSNAVAVPPGNSNVSAAAPKPVGNPASPAAGDTATAATTDTIAPASPPPPPAKDEAEKSRDAKTLSLAKRESLPAVTETEKKTDNPPYAMQSAPNNARSMAKMRAGGPRQVQNQAQNNGMLADGNEAGSERRIADKTFEFKQGVWYDTAYSGQRTINVRRGTGEYKKLDAGVRSVAGSLSGTVVVVSGAKAYRID